MKLRSLPQFTRNARRFTEIVSILTKHGLANWIAESDPEFLKGLFKSSRGVRLSGLTHEARIRLAITELGPTFIKLGQILSTRADLVGSSLAKELSALQSDAPADTPDVVRTTLESELGKSAEELFADFDDRASASASIGQVHLAKLHLGPAVVVKVQHEGIEEKVTTDLDILMALAELAEKYNPELRLYQPRAMVAEFRRNLLRELDFRREQRNIEQFVRNFEGDPTIHIPTPYPELSARRILTMEKLEGFSISKIDLLRKEGIDTKELARRGANVFLDMIFRDRFYHADPHPGNIWVLAGGNIGLLDCGMVGRLDDQTQEEIEEVLLAAVQRDAIRLTDYVIRLGSVPQDLDRDALRRDLDEFIEEYGGQSLKVFDLSGALNGMAEIIWRYRIILPPAISSLLKALVMLEGTSRLLDRDFSLAELLEPYQAKAVQRRFSPQRLFYKLQRSYKDWDRFINMLPRDLGEILQRVREGKFDIHLEHRRLDATVNRLVYGILTAALFLGSCQLLGRQIPPLLGGISILGAAGCLLAAALGFRLFRAIKKSGDLIQKE
ncbi:MAG: AarF/ABC1/UbiB kinase family protein [Deltaproteobacteria bacterium]|nr:MAG: AarF/ABC1/UbiB kinase family protein [Deltaproteobacteria bacterium]